MAALSLDQFVKALVASGLMTADELKSLWAAVPADARPTTGNAFAQRLVEQGKLTKFQAEELLAGRGSSLLMGDYVLVDELGAGGMGKVYKARHRTMQRIVALKVMSLAAMQDEAAVKRFQREVRAAAKLEHSNIVTAYDSGTAGKVSYLVMQFVDGGDLASLVRKHGVLDVERAIEFICQTAQGLAYAHGEGVVHRDIKPANLLVDKRGVVKILDMGLARIDDGDGLTGTEQVMGTVDYMSPEQAADTKHVDARTDIYSLGCTLWYLLTGKRMYDGDTAIKRLMKHREQPRPSLVKARDDVSWPLEQIFHKMVAVESQNRYASMDEVLTALEPHRPSRSSTSTTGMGSSLGMGGEPRDAELSAFFKTVGPGGPQPGATTKSPAQATSAATDATAMHVPGQADTDPKSEMLAPSPKSVGRDARRSETAKSDGPPMKWIAAGVGVCAILLIGAFVFFKSRGGDETAISPVAASGTVGVGRPVAPQGSIVPQAVAPKAPTPSENYALRFGGTNGTKAFAIPGWNYQGDTPLTIEAWIIPENLNYQSYLGNGKQAGLRLGMQPYQWEFHFQREAGGAIAGVSSDRPATQGRRTHVAVITDRSSMLMFIDGVEQERTGYPRGEYLKVTQPFMIGASIDNSGPNQDRWHGACAAVIDELRISRVVRYVKNFIPAARSESDADTEVLYHFDEGKDDTAFDASPYARHAKLERSSWVKADGSAIAPLSTTFFSTDDGSAATSEGTAVTSEEQIALAERIVAQGGRALFSATGLPYEITFKTRADLNGLGKPYLTEIAVARDSSLIPKEVDVLTRSLLLHDIQIDGCIWVTNDVIRKLCRNKTIRVLRITNTSATRAVVPDIATLADLQTLYCSNLGFADDDLLLLATLPQLNYVQFDHLPVTSAGIAHLAKFPQLKSLFMRHVPIDEAGVEALAKLSGLKEMNISDSGITAAQLAKLKAALPQCKFGWDNPGAEPKP